MGRPIIDLTGQRFGKLVVERRVEDKICPKGHKRPMWECRCDCGNIKIASGARLRGGKAKSCGCDENVKRNENGQFVKGQLINDLTGKRYGMLTVLGLDRIENRCSWWTVKCDCGTVKSVRGSTLKVIRSCGCIKKKQDLINLHITNNHELTYHPVYHIWNAMIQRCENPKFKYYKDYGGRGIKVCEEWKDIRNFSKWADQSGFPGKNLSIERVDVNGNYCPENCCWIDRKYQARNCRNTIRLVINGTERPLVEWAEIYGIKYELVMGRYQKGYREPNDLFYKGNLQMRDCGNE